MESSINTSRSGAPAGMARREQQWGGQPGDRQSDGAQMHSLRPAEQTLLIAGGVALTSLLLSRRPLLTLCAIGTSGYMLYRSVTGHCPITEAIKSVSEQLQSGREGDGQGDRTSSQRVGAMQSQSRQQSEYSRQASGASSGVQLPLRVSQEPRQSNHGQAVAPHGTQHAEHSTPSYAGLHTSVIQQAAAAHRESDMVDEAVKESFPASDPPSYSGGTATPHTQPPL